MSNALAIAAVTATLRNLLMQVTNDPELSDTSVTVQPLDKARSLDTVNQVNLFLYHTSPNAAWRNQDFPQQVKPGETGQPPLALDLFYLVTAYGRGDDEVLSNRVLGRAMSILHDRPLLGATEIQNALPDNDLYQQVERVRITPQPMSLEEISKLWTTFQTQYRISVAYQVSLVLIESTRPSRTPLPVLRRGENDAGVKVQSSLVPPFPTLESITPPNQQPSVQLGEILTLAGHHLAGDDITVEFRQPRLEDPIQITDLLETTATQIRVQIPNTDEASTDWVSGFYTLSVGVTPTGDQPRITNELAFALAPQIQTVPPISAIRNGNDVTLTVGCRPQVRPEQEVTLLLGDRAIPPQPYNTPTETLTFIAREIAAGNYWVRLRVDGVDSLLIDRSTTPPSFNPSQEVTL